MKEMENKPEATEIVLDDKEFSPIIRRLIEEAIQKGYSKTLTMQAISKTWSTMITKKEHVKPEPTDNELAFFEKVDQFFSEYGHDFIRRLTWSESAFSWRKLQNIPEYAEHIIDDLKVFTKSVYCVFCREDAITIQKIRKYSKDFFNTKYAVTSDMLYPISCALQDLIIVDNNKPVCIFQNKEERAKYKDVYSLGIEKNENYCDFVKKYSYRNTVLNKVSMQLIWMISTYY